MFQMIFLLLFIQDLKRQWTSLKPNLSSVLGSSNRVCKNSLFIHNWCTLLLIEHRDAQLWFIVFQSQLKMDLLSCINQKNQALSPVKFSVLYVLLQV